jgi:hypothetical protein
MVMQQALRPHAIAGVALALGASLIALTPATAPSPAVPHVYLPAIQLTGGDPNTALENLISTLDSNLNSDMSTLESDVTSGLSTLESALTSDLSGLGLSGLDSDLVQGFSALESDVTSGFSTLSGDLTTLLDGNGVSVDNWLEAINEKIAGLDSDLLNSLQGIDTLLGNGVGQLVNIDYILFIECGVACADFAP